MLNQRLGGVVKGISEDYIKNVTGEKVNVMQAELEGRLLKVVDNVLNDEDNIWCITNGELVGMVYKEVNLKVEIEQFLFSKECYFTSYEDDCGPEPKSIREIFDYFLTLPEDEIMVAHDRS